MTNLQTIIDTVEEFYDAEKHQEIIEFSKEVMNPENELYLKSEIGRALNNIGNEKNDPDKFKEALKYLLEVDETESDSNAETKYRVAFSYYRLNDTGNAQKYINECLKIDKENQNGKRVQSWIDDNVIFIDDKKQNEIKKSLINPANLFSEVQFWDVIEISKKAAGSAEEQLEKLTSILDGLSTEELMGYYYQFLKSHNEAYLGNLWAVAYIVLGGCSDDGFMDFRYWLISRGKDIFTLAIQNPDSLCQEFDTVDYPSLEGISYIPNEVFNKKYGGDSWDDEESKYNFEFQNKEIDFEWDEDNKASLKKVCPKTFEKWWDNDKF